MRYFPGIYYLPSHRTGSMVLIYNDNKYWINNRYQNTINWTCRDRKRLGCNSCVQTTIEGRYLKHKGFHNHEDNYTKYNFNDWCRGLPTLASDHLRCRLFVELVTCILFAFIYVIPLYFSKYFKFRCLFISNIYL